MYDVKVIKQLIDNCDEITCLVKKRGFSFLRLFKPTNISYQNKLHFLVRIDNQDVSLFDLGYLKSDLAKFLDLDSDDLIVITENSLETTSEIIEKKFEIRKENFFEIIFSLFEKESEIVKISCLLGCEEDVNFLKTWISTTNKNKLYPTSIAASKEQLLLLEYFLTSIKDDENIYKNLFLDALQVAAICEKTKVLEFLYNLNPKFELHTPIYFENYPIHAAAAYGNVAAVKFLFEKHPESISILNAGKERLIDLAAKSGNVELVKFLLDKYSINLNACNEIGRFPIHYAVSFDNVNLVRWLIEQGANPEIETEDWLRLNPIHFAANFGNLAVLKELKKHIVNLHAFNQKGLTPLHMAVMEGRKDIVEWLLQNEADAKQTTQDNYKNNLFHIAAIYGHYDCLDLLLRKGEQNQVDYHVQNALGDYPLHYAAAGWSKLEHEFYIALIAKKSLNDNNKNYQTTLSSLDKIRKDFPLPLYRFFNVVVFLKTLVLDAVYPSDFFETKIKWETMNYSHQKVLIWLLEQQQNDINQTTNDGNGYTACHFAAAFGQLDNLKLLYNKGADIYKVNNKGYSPIDIAIMYDQLNIIEWALEQGILGNFFASSNEIYSNTPLSLAWKNNSIKSIRFFIEHELQINEKIKKSINTWEGFFTVWRPIHYLSLMPIEDHPNLIDLTTIISLLNSNIMDINALTPHGETIFHLLMRNLVISKSVNKLDNCMRLISLLISQGLDVHIRTNYTLPEFTNECIKEAGYNQILRNIIQDVQAQQIVVSLLHIFKEHGVYIDVSPFINYYCKNFHNSRIKTEFLEFILQYFPEIYPAILEECSKNLFSEIKTVLSIPPIVLAPTGGLANCKQLKIIEGLIHYGFMIGQKLAKNEIEQLKQINSITFIYLAVGVQLSDTLLPGKPILNSANINVKEISPQNLLLFLNILKCLLIKPLDVFSEKDVSEVKNLFCILAHAVPLIDNFPQNLLSLISQLLDKMLSNPSEKLKDQDINDLKFLHREIYIKVTKQSPSLLELCEDAIIRSPNFYIEYSSKDHCNKIFSFFGNFSRRIRENRECILNKVHLLKACN